MKFKQLTSAALLSVMLAVGASCSSDNNMDPDNNSNLPDGNQVVSFIIQNASDINTRADGDDVEGDDKFVNGTGAESEIDNVILVFFKNDGSFFTVKKPEFVKTSDGNWNHTQETVYSAEVSLTIKDGVRPTQVLCIINGEGKNYDLSNTSLIVSEASFMQTKPTKQQILDAIGNFEVEIDDEKTGPKEPLMMTNSVYLAQGDNGTSQIYNLTKIPSTAFYMPGEDTEGHDIVHIDVERVNSKVHIISKLNEPANIEGAEVTFEGEIQQITPKILSIKMGQLTKKSYFVKSLNGYENYDVQDWISQLYPRSYWATSPSLVPWNQLDKNGNFADANSDYIYYTFDEMEDNSDETEWTYYPQENTTDYPTAIIVKTTLVDEEGNELEDLIDVTGTRKIFITMESYKQMVSKDLVLLGLTYRKPGDNGSTIISEDWTSMIELQRTRDAEDQPFVVKPYLNYGSNPDKINETDLMAAVNALKDFPSVLCYKDGKSFFYVEINHDLLHINESGDLARKKGLVRNHAYEITLKSLKGLGSPVFDPSQIVIPGSPDEVLGLDAEIHPLKWRMIFQEADLK